MVTTVADWKGFDAGAYIFDSWSQGYDSNGNLVDLFSLTGHYYAADAGFHSDNTGYDVSTSSVLLADGQSYGTATAVLSYVYGDPSVGVTGPTTTYANGTYTQNGFIYDAQFVEPVTWQWTVDGNPMSETSSTFTWQAGSAGTVQQVDVTATDYNGLSHSATQFVTACDQQFYC